MATGSPDPTSARPSATRRERRSRLRVDVLGQVAAHARAPQPPLHLRELSETGFSLESTQPFEYNVEHLFRIGIDGTWKAVIVHAKVRHCSLTAMCGDLTIYVTGFEILPTHRAVMGEVRSLVQFAEGMWMDEGAEG